jgi:hypothetical protein
VPSKGLIGGVRTALSGSVQTDLLLLGIRVDHFTSCIAPALVDIIGRLAGVSITQVHVGEVQGFTGGLHFRLSLRVPATTVSMPWQVHRYPALQTTID